VAIVTVRLTPWSDGSEFQVKFDTSSITAEATDTGCVLQLPIELSPDGYDGGPCLIAIHGSMSIGDTSGRNRVEIPMQSMHPNYRHLRVSLTASDLLRIEARRAGSTELHCNLSLGGVAKIHFKVQPRQQVTVPQAFDTTTVHDNGTMPFAIGREQWLSLLAKAGSGWTRLVELPGLVEPAETEWVGCTALLQRATTEYRNGANESAIATCRLVLEGLVVVIAKRWSVARQPGQSIDGWLKELQGRLAKAWPADEDAARVLTSLYSAVWSWTSDPHHYGSKVPLHREAAFTVGLTSELLSHAGHLLAAHPEPAKVASAPAGATDGSPKE